jgi:hypothetical protein
MLFFILNRNFQDSDSNFLQYVILHLNQNFQDSGSYPSYLELNFKTNFHSSQTNIPGRRLKTIILCETFFFF